MKLPLGLSPVDALIILGWVLAVIAILVWGALWA